RGRPGQRLVVGRTPRYGGGGPSISPPAQTLTLSQALRGGASGGSIFSSRSRRIGFRRTSRFFILRGALHCHLRGGLGVSRDDGLGRLACRRDGRLDGERRAGFAGWCRRLGGRRGGFRRGGGGHPARKPPGLAPPPPARSS